ncbi:hypothetical protein BN1708_009681 [Verticillium longisporum]|nr:hypothetical protein BN1708_009681 [Verticillium longisporum]
MSGETRQYRQCTCSASFETEHNLSEHIEGIRNAGWKPKSKGAEVTSKLTTRTARTITMGRMIMKTTAMASAKRSNMRVQGWEMPPERIVVQRVNGRNPSKPDRGFGGTFGSVLGLASEYIRHAEKHPQASGRKRDFIDRTCTELRERAYKELDDASRRTAKGVTERKRTAGVANLRTEAPRTKRTHQFTDDGISGETPQLRGCNVAPMGVTPMRSPLPLLPVPHAVEAVNAGDYLSMYGDVFEFQSTNALGLVEEFDAPLLQIMNGIPTTFQQNG